MKWVRECGDPILEREWGGGGGEVHSWEQWEGPEIKKKWYKATPRGLEGHREGVMLLMAGRR